MRRTYSHPLDDMTYLKVSPLTIVRTVRNHHPTYNRCHQITKYKFHALQPNFLAIEALSEVKISWKWSKYNSWKTKIRKLITRILWIFFDIFNFRHEFSQLFTIIIDHNNWPRYIWTKNSSLSDINLGIPEYNKQKYHKSTQNFETNRLVIFSY